MENIKNKLKNMSSAIWITIATGFMLFLYAPIEIYLNNYMDFAFDIYDLLKFMPAIFAGFCFSALLFFSLAKKINNKFWLILLALCFAGVISLFLQGTFFASDLPLFDGSEIDWSKYDHQRITSIIIWSLSVLFSVLLFIILKKEKFTHFISVFGKVVTAYLLLSIIITCCTTGNGLNHRKTSCMTADSMFKMSKDQNFIILLTDCVDATVFNEVMEENPEYENVFEDFTFFSNTMGGYAYTTRAVPFILFGNWYDNTVYYPYWIRDSIEASPLMNRLIDDNYDKSIYFEYIERANLDSDMFENFKEVTDFNEPVKFCKMILKLVGMRYMPYDLKKFCTLTPDNIYFDTLKSNKNEEIDYYELDNPSFYNRILNTDITFSPNKCYRFLYNNGAHAPFIFDKDANIIESGSYKQNIQACITITNAYLQKLKDAGVYDNSVIIILADHGVNLKDSELIDDKQNPYMLIKGINEKHPYRKNDAPVSHADLQDAYMKLIDGADSNECFDWHEGDERARRYMYSDVIIADTIYEYMQYGHASDESTMLPTGNIYEFDGQCIIDRQELERQKGTMSDVIF